MIIRFWPYGLAVLAGYLLGWVVWGRPLRGAEDALKNHAQVVADLAARDSAYRVLAAEIGRLDSTATAAATESLRLRRVAANAYRAGQQAAAIAHGQASDSALARGDTVGALQQARAQVRALDLAYVSCTASYDSLTVAAVADSAALASCRQGTVNRDKMLALRDRSLDDLQRDADRLADLVARAKRRPKWAAGPLWTSESRSGVPQGGWGSRDIGPVRVLVGAVDVGGLVGIGGLALQF